MTAHKFRSAERRREAAAGDATFNRYDEYGILGATNVGRFQYTGQAWIPELGLYHYKARTYSPTLGRFMQTDRGGMKIRSISMLMWEMTL